MRVQPAPNGLEQLSVTAPELDAEFTVDGVAPVQAIGTVTGREMYFRARHENWLFEVADKNGNLPSDGYRDSDGFIREGSYKNASYMPLRDAVKIIVKQLEEYTGALAIPE